MDSGEATDDGAGWPLRVLGIALIVVPFVPLRGLSGPLEGAEAWVTPSEWALGLAIFGLTAWLVVLAAGDSSPELAALTSRLGKGGDAVWVAGGLGALAVLLLLAGARALGHAPQMVDSVAQLFHAEIFADGRLAAPPPREAEFFVTQNMVLDRNGWYSQYPPGHPALLVPGVLASASWVVPVLLTLGTGGFLFSAAKRMWGDAVARLTLVLLVLSSFFWIMGASFMNHVSALFFVSLFLYLFVRWEQEGGAGTAVGAGAALGAAALSRPLTAAAVAVAFAAFAVRSRWRLLARRGGKRRGARRGKEGRGRDVVRSLRPLVPAGLGFAGVASLYLLYNAGVSGDPFLTGYLELWGSSHGLGFHETPWGGQHTPLDGIRQEVLDLSLLNLFLFEWPVPALLPVGAAFALGWATDRWDRRLLVGALALPAAYFFYWHRDAVFGPRFLYGSLAFLLPLTARTLVLAGERLEGREWQVGSLFRPVSAGRWAAFFVGFSALYGIVYGVPGRFGAYATSGSEMKLDIRGEARDAGIDGGLVFVKVSWGNRLLARLRGAGVPASESVQAYRNVGHCELTRFLDRAVPSGWTEGRITSELQKMRARGDSLVKTAELNGDPTLRLRAGRELPQRCRRELRYDESGYTIFTPHLLANRPDLTGDFVVARDLGPLDDRLRERFPDRQAYLFDGEDFVRLDDAAGAGPAAEGYGDANGATASPTEGGRREGRQGARP